MTYRQYAKQHGYRTEITATERRSTYPQYKSPSAATGIGMQLMRTLLGSHWQPKALLLQHSPVCEPSSYRRMLGLVPQFNAQLNAWVFDAKLLDSPLSTADKKLHTLIQQHLENLDQISIQELPAYVQQLMRNFLPNGRVTIELTADYMMISPRTLQRYLTKEGASFQQLLEHTRQSIASRYVRDSTISLTQLAYLLGYSNLRGCEIFNNFMC